MSIWKDREGRYHVALQRGGKRVHHICPPTATAADAKRREAALVADFGRAASQTLIGDAIQRWLTEDVATQKAKRITEGHAYALADSVEGRLLTEIHTVAAEYRQTMRAALTNSTINRRLSVLRRVANLAYKRWGWLTEPLAQKIEMLPENAARERYLTRDELAVLLRAIPLRNARRAVLVAAFTGLRRGELCNLRPVNVQGDLIYLKTTKTGRPRVVPVVEHVRFALRRLPFGSHPDWLSHLVNAAMPGTRFHDLRHTAASMLIQAGVPLYTVGAILGHTTPATTKRYAHLAVDDLRAAVDKMRNAQELHRRDFGKNRKVA